MNTIPTVNQAALAARTKPADTLALDELVAAVSAMNEEAERVRNETEALVALGKAQQALADAQAERDSLLTVSNESPTNERKRDPIPWRSAAVLVAMFAGVAAAVTL